MATDPRLLLMGQSVDIAQPGRELQNTMLNMSNLQSQEVNRQGAEQTQAQNAELAPLLLRQKAEQIEAAQLANNEQRKQMEDLRGRELHTAFKSLRALDQAQRVDTARIMSQTLNGFGVPFEYLQNENNLTDDALDKIVSAYSRFSLGAQGGLKSQKGESVFFEKDGKQFRSTSVFNPATKQIEEVVTEIGASADVTSKLGETVAEKTQRKIKEAGATQRAKLQEDLRLKPDIAAGEVTGKGIATRRQEIIDNGLDAADGYANLVRAKDLLDTVETGGIDAASLRAKQLFGVEGADEAELSNRMGKAVLSQLRTTFGAAFTAKEGESLSRIEAGFGKSTEGNKRLLDQTIKIVNRSAQRGIRAAEAAGDKESAQNIREALSFRLGDSATNDTTSRLDELRAKAGL